MRLAKIIIEGFRSFGERQTIEFDNLTAFIGENSAGKTAALAAIGKIFGQRQSERQLTRSDFHLPRNMKPEDVDELELSIEAVLEFDKLSSPKSYSEVAIFYDYLTINGPEKTPIVRIRLSATWTRSANAEGSIDSEVSFIKAAEGEAESKDNCVAAKRQVLDSIRMIYVPASRNPKSELRPVSGTIMGGLIRSVNWSEGRKETIKEKIDEISDAVLEEPGAKVINTSLHDAWNKLDGDIRYGNTRLTFGGSSFESVISHPAVAFSPTPEERDYEVEELGDGLQSLFYFSMVKGLVNLEDKLRTNDDNMKDYFDVDLPALTLLAVEEPENHIAPHLLGKLMLELKELSEESHCQVIVTSHSPAIAKRVEPKEIRRFRMRRESNSTICRRLSLPDNAEAEAYKFVRGSLLTYPEVLFAKAVVLGEGSSEEIVLPRAIQALCGEADTLGISVAPLGGRHVNHFWKLLNDLDIPYVTLLDLDLERHGGGWGRIKYAASKLEEFKQDELFDWPGGLSSNSPEFKTLDRRSNDNPELSEWIDYLESKGVFFSEPLDLDFAMLCAFPNVYKNIDGTDGPHNEENDPDSSTTEMYAEIRQHAVEYVLHSGKYGSGGDGATYTEEQKSLMPYYKNLFLGNRGKPTTHILALTNVDDESFKQQMPETLKRLAETVSTLVLESPVGANDEE